MGLSDSRPGPFPRLLIPSGRWGRLPFPALPGLPGSSTDLFLRAVPNHPGRSDECLLIASPPISGFIPSGGLATFTDGSQVCFPGFHQTVYPASLRLSYMHERAIYMVNSFQFTRSARLSLVYRINTDKQTPRSCFIRVYPCSSVAIVFCPDSSGCRYNDAYPLRGAPMTYYGPKDMAASFRTVRGNTIKIAEEIPEESYGFRAAPECRSVAETLVHIAVGPRFQEQIHLVE